MGWLRAILGAQAIVDEVGPEKARGIGEAARAFNRYGDTPRGRQEVDRICKKHGITREERRRVGRRLLGMD